MAHESSLLERRHRILGSGAPLFYDEPLHLVRGEGVHVWDADGNRYIDAYNNVPHVGHCHPRVVEALHGQAATLNLSTRYLDQRILDYGERLAATFDESLSRVVLCCSGTESSELALRIARACTGNEGIIVTDFCYHGNSATIAALCTAFEGPEGIDPRVRAIRVPDSYRPVEGAGPDSAEPHLAGVREALASLAEAGMKPAAIFFDTLFATEGVPELPPGYVEGAVALVREAGGLYVADEVQPGFGRTGSHMWGHGRFDATPDLVTLGKPMGNGFPLAGVVARPDLLDTFTARAMYFNTFGGNPVACAVGEAVLQVIEEEALMENARTTGAYLLEGLRSLKQKHARLGDARGHGLFVAVELVEDRKSRAPAEGDAKAAVEGLRRRGVLVGRTGRYGNALKIRPPMPFQRGHADEVLAALDETLASLATG